MTGLIGTSFLSLLLLTAPALRDDAPSLAADGVRSLATVETDDAIFVVQYFFQASSVEERMRYLLDTAGTRASLERFLLDHPATTNGYTVTSTMEREGKLDDWITVSVAAGAERIDFNLKKTADGLRIDWPSTIGENAITLDDLGGALNVLRHYRATVKLSDGDPCSGSRMEGAYRYLHIIDGDRQEMVVVDASDETIRVLQDWREHKAVLTLGGSRRLICGTDEKGNAIGPTFVMEASIGALDTWIVDDRRAGR